MELLTGVKRNIFHTCLYNLIFTFFFSPYKTKGAPELLLSDSSAQLVQRTLPVLGLPATPISVSGCRRRTFDLSIAQTFVLLSSLIYERDTRKVKDAYDLYTASKKAASAAGSSSTSPALEAQAENIIESRMKELLWESEARIRQIAESWGLHFAGVSELKSLGGPFCGIFWSEAANFIVVAFKGTTPTNYEEFLVDATFQRTDARSFLFGCVHEGFYESLFSTSGFGDQDVRDPYGAILAAVRSKAAQIQEQLGTNEPVQLWIAGHSLGAALSSLLFARWLKSPSDLGRRLVLRDAYVIGTPAVGDSDFASTFASHSNQPVTRASTLFRIINKSDIFSRLPPGYDSKTCGKVYIPLIIMIMTINDLISPLSLSLSLSLSPLLSLFKVISCRNQTFSIILM